MRIYLVPILSLSLFWYFLDLERSINLVGCLVLIIGAYVWLLQFLKKSGKSAFVFQIFIWVTIADVFFLLLYTSVAQRHSVFNERYTINYLDHTAAIVISSLLPGVVMLIFAFFMQRSHKEKSFLDVNRNLTPLHLKVSMAVVLACFLSFFSDFLFEVPFLSYFARFAHGAFILYAFWFGFWNKKLGSLWLIILAVYFLYVVFIIVSGGRFTAFVTIALFYFGYTSSMPKKLQIVSYGIMIALAPFIFYISGLLGVVRNSIGRGDYDIVNEKRFALFQQTLTGEWELGSSNSGRVIEYSLGRNIKWPNLAVLGLVPERIKYRGLENLDAEFYSLFEIAGLNSGFSNEQVRDYREKMIKAGLGNSAANRYGYSVTRLNSVEWSVLADAWSRGGGLFYFIYLSFALFLLLVVEKKFLDRASHPAFTTLLVSVIVQLIWFRIGSQPLYLFIRFFILQIGFSLSLLYGLNMFKSLVVNKHSRKL
jgi:hypothetical protein